MATSVQDVVARLRALQHGPAILLGEGTDHAAFEIDGAFIVRVIKRPDENTAAAIDREVRVLAAVAQISPLPVPEVVASDREKGVLVLRKLSGQNLLDAPSVYPARLVDSLAVFLSRIHAAPVEHMQEIAGVDDYDMRDWWSDAERDAEQVMTHLTRVERRCIERFLSAWPPPANAARAFCHNDLGAEHLLVSPDRARLVGVLDWSDAAVSDPARDLGRIYRDFGPNVARAVVSRLSVELDDEILLRAAFYARCALLEDLAYGFRTDARRYIERARANLQSAFEER